jgi:hypothetical protein
MKSVCVVCGVWCVYVCVCLYVCVCVCVCVRERERERERESVPSYRGMYRERTRVTYTYITHTIATNTSAAVTTCMLTIISTRQDTSGYVRIRQRCHNLHADYYQPSKMCWLDLKNKNTRNLLPVAAAPFFSLRILVREKGRSASKQSN